MKKNKKLGFTLVEVLIVVVIMAILAATIIPQFSDSTKDAKTNTAKFNLHTIRSQIEMFKSQHDGKVPALLTDLTLKTNSSGTTGTGAAFVYGPYLATIPANPFNGLSTVGTTATNPPTAGTGANGWLYHTASGGVFIDDSVLYTE